MRIVNLTQRYRNQKLGVVDSVCPVIKKPIIQKHVVNPSIKETVQLVSVFVEKKEEKKVEVVPITSSVLSEAVERKIKIYEDKDQKKELSSLGEIFIGEEVEKIIYIVNEGNTKLTNIKLVSETNGLTFNSSTIASLNPKECSSMLLRYCSSAIQESEETISFNIEAESHFI